MSCHLNHPSAVHLSIVDPLEWSRDVLQTTVQPGPRGIQRCAGGSTRSSQYERRVSFQVDSIIVRNAMMEMVMVMIACLRIIKFINGIPHNIWGASPVILSTHSQRLPVVVRAIPRRVAMMWCIASTETVHLHAFEWTCTFRLLWWYIAYMIWWWETKLL